MRVMKTRWKKIAATATPEGEAEEECCGRGATALPARKRLNHRGPLSIDVSSAWYFITVCAEGHATWTIDPSKRAFHGRAVALRPPLSEIAPLILHEARENHVRCIWRLAVFLVMPDHVHFIVRVPSNGGCVATSLPALVRNFKHLLASRYGIRFQRDFFDTRLRNDADFSEKYDYILGNPVRKGLCTVPSEWPYSILFDR